MSLVLIRPVLIVWMRRARKVRCVERCPGGRSVYKLAGQNSFQTGGLLWRSGSLVSTLSLIRERIPDPPCRLFCHSAIPDFLIEDRRRQETSPTDQLHILPKEDEDMDDLVCRSTASIQPAFFLDAETLFPDEDQKF